jgi:hypothetical protein
MNWKNLVFGIIIGLSVGLALSPTLFRITGGRFPTTEGRYEMKNAGSSVLVKIDKWTGQAWVLERSEWK